MKTVMERLSARSDQQSECLVWTGHRLEKSGHGQIQVLGRKMLVHRAAWIERHGPIPPETPHVLHRCDNPPCWRDDHLWLGTHADNMADMAAKGRASRHMSARTHCPRGHAYDEVNTGNSNGSRYCRTCSRERVARFRARHGRKKVAQ